MAKFPTMPDLFDSALQFDIKTLKKHGYLKAGQVQSGVLTWTRNGATRGEISIQVNTTFEPYLLTLSYKFRNEPRDYSVRIVSKASNLGKGEVHYFVCPKTGLLCRKLFSIGGYFYHRNAFTGAMYESQTQSKKMRFFERRFGAIFDREAIYLELNKKHAKTTYRGKPTKKYARLCERLQQMKEVDSWELEAALLS